MQRAAVSWSGDVGLPVAQCLGVAIWAAALVLGASVPVATGIAVGAAGMCLVRVRGRGLFDLVVSAVRFRSAPVPVPGLLRDFTPAAGGPVGLRWDGPFVTAVVEVLPPAGPVVRLGRDNEETDAVLPLGAIAACLRRHDVVLDGIDVVVHGRRVHDGTPAGRAYAHLVGPLPAAADRVVRLVLRLDATSCPEAVARRGGGTEGVARTVIAAARRVIRALADGGYAARLLTAREIEQAALRIAHGVPVTELEQTRWQVLLPVGADTGGAIDPRRVCRATLTAVWSRAALSSTVVVRLRPAEHGAVRAGALVRFTTSAPEAPTVPGLRPSHGRHRESFTAALPFGVPGPESLVPLRETAPEELDALALPAGGCGQLIGSDDDGRAVTARLTGPGVRSVYLAGELYLAQQVVFRAVAVGARVVLYTDRPVVWRTLTSGAAGPDRLQIAGEHPDDREFDTVVFDGVRPVSIPPHVTAIHVHSHPDEWPREAPTVSLLQPGAVGDRVMLAGGGTRTTLNLVTIAEESAHLARSRAVGFASAAGPGQPG